MGLFSNPKCPIHRVEYSIGKNYLCQQYYYCKKCQREKQAAKDEKASLIARIEALEKLVNS
jgi:hypothetical protein